MIRRRAIAVTSAFAPLNPRLLAVTVHDSLICLTKGMRPS